VREVVVDMTEIGSLVLFSTNYDRTVEFYNAVRCALEHEDHDDGPAHHAVELGAVHFAVYPAESVGQAPGRRTGASTFPEFFVDSLDDTAALVTPLSEAVLEGRETMPWGCRMVFADPDGRPVEVNQRDHCG